MRICSRCNKELRKTDLVCPRCDVSTVRDIYGKRVTNFATTKNYHGKNVNLNTKNNPKAAIIASIICGILEYNYYIEDMRAQIDGLQVQIDELKKINNQMDENYRDALAVNVEMEEVEEDTNETADTTDTTDTASTATETTETANVVE